VHDDHTLTYAELNARANRVAHRLIASACSPTTASRCASSAASTWSSGCSRA
jgi:non-ribosomal peptide synthetase component F